MSAAALRKPKVSQIAVAANDTDLITDKGRLDIMDAMALSKKLGHPIVIRTQISPETACWLLGLNDGNRIDSEPTRIKYVNDMISGRWVENGGGFSISTCDKLNNGQHRCRAINESGTTQYMNVTVGLTRESRETIDTGLSRTLSNILTMAGIPNATIAGTMTKLVMGWERTSTGAKRPTRENSIPAIQEFIGKDPSIAASAAFVRTVKVPVGLLSKPQVGFLHNVLMKHCPQKAEEFLRGLVTGAQEELNSATGKVENRGLMMSDPRMTTRMRLIDENKLLKHADRIELVFRAWNAWREGRTLRQTKVNGNIPDLV